MPTPLVNGNILKVTIACRMPTHSQVGLNVLHYRVTSAGGANLEDVPYRIYTRIRSQYVGWLPSICEFTGVSVTRLSVQTTSAGPFYYVLPTAGQNGATMAPLQASGIIRYTTPGNDQLDPPIPSAKGRSYVPFVSLASYTGTSAILNNTGWQKLNSIRSVLGPQMLLPSGPNLQLVLKRTQTNPPPAPPTVLGYTDVTVMLALEAIATQRRRGDFGKINNAFGGAI